MNAFVEATIMKALFVEQLTLSGRSIATNNIKGWCFSAPSVVVENNCIFRN